MGTLDKKPLWLFLIVGLCTYAIVLSIQPWERTERILLGRNDFSQLYAGANLAGRKLDFWAGMALCLCAIKPHLFILMPLVVIPQRRWRILAGAAVGGTILLALSFLVGGPNWFGKYRMSLQGQTPDLDHMPNIHSFSVLLGRADFPVQGLLTPCVVVATHYLVFTLAGYVLV